MGTRLNIFNKAALGILTLCFVVSVSSLELTEDGVIDDGIFETEESEEPLSSRDPKCKLKHITDSRISLDSNINIKISFFIMYICVCAYQVVVNQVKMLN